MRSRWCVAALLLLAIQVSGLKKGVPEAAMGLQCIQPLPSNFVNCSWLTWGSQNANTTYVLRYQSHKMGKVLLDLGQVHSMVAQVGQNWLVIERSDLRHGDQYDVWMEVSSADGIIAVSKKLNFSLHETAMPCLPEVVRVHPDCSDATVTWKNPHWSELDRDHHPTYAIRYKASTDQEWTYETHLNQESHDLGDLDPFTCYAVQVRCVPENQNDLRREWSSPTRFCTCETVDVWQEGCASDRQNGSCSVVWKGLDLEASQGTILHYEVIFQDHHKTVRRMNYNCCQALVPIDARHVSVAALTSVQKTPWANLSLERTELPGPEGVTVVASEGLGLNVTWQPSTDPQWVQPQNYVVEWRKEIADRSAGELLNWTRTPGSSTSALLRGNFSSKVPYLVCVHGLYAHGRTASDTVRTYYREEVPSAGPQGLQDRSLSSSATSITWEEIPLAGRNGHIVHYTLYLKDLHSGGLTVHAPIGATERNYTISDLEPGTTYQVWMTGSTSAGEGAVSAVHHFSTSASDWTSLVVVFVVVGFLLVVGSVTVLLKYQWLQGLCRKLLPRWCWEKIPDPKHSGIAVEMNEEGTSPVMETLTECPPQFPEIMDIAEISEQIPEPSPPRARSNGPVTSGYEKRRLPTPEEILSWVEQERNPPPFPGLRAKET